MNQAAQNPFRWLPHAAFPPYTYVPGTGTPHPVSSPEGHSYHEGHAGEPRHAPLEADRWVESVDFLRAIDLFNHGYYWEAHEAWEGLWIGSGRTTTVALLLKSLIKLAAAGVKVREGNRRGVERHAQRSLQLLEQVRQQHGAPQFCGFDLRQLQSAAATAAETTWQTDPRLQPGQAVVVFPFALVPDADAA